MHDIFISYAREDIVQVRELVKLFERESWTTFFDRDVAAGRGFPEALDAEIKAAKCVVVAWSESSTGSTWVRGEAHRALDRDILIPVVLSPVEVPLPFNAIESIDLCGWPSTHRDLELRRLISGVRQVVDSTAKTRKQIPIRDDPTLSSRVAKRVVDALRGRESAGIEYDRMLNEVGQSLLSEPALAADALVQGIYEHLGCHARLLSRNKLVAQAPHEHVSGERAASWNLEVRTQSGELTLVCFGDRPPEIELKLPLVVLLLERIELGGSHHR